MFWQIKVPTKLVQWMLRSQAMSRLKLTNENSSVNIEDLFEFMA